jgi:hypothetical protein
VTRIPFRAILRYNGSYVRTENEQICNNCRKPITQLVIGRPRARFCSRACSDEYFAEERRQAVQRFRECGMTVERRAEEAAE